LLATFLIPAQMRDILLIVVPLCRLQRIRNRAFDCCPFLGLDA
jgi:hypothetical protein